jgi:hypothetical protein
LSAWYKLLKPALIYFRRQRAARIKERFPDLDKWNVLDLGGSLHLWEEVGSVLKPASLTILNIAKDGQSASGSGNAADFARIVLYDGRTIPFDDQEVDLLICNSVIEHVPPPERAGLAREIVRVAKRFVVQTPAKEFPLEPHFVFPLIHWLPAALARRLVAITPLALVIGRDEAKTMFDEVRLLGEREIRALFPGGKIIRERLLGMTKSYLVFG